MLALNSSILVAAPRWRRSLVSVVSLGTGTSAGRPAKWRTPSSAIRVLAVCSSARKGSNQKGHRVLARGAKLRGSVQEMLRKRILTRGHEQQGLSVVYTDYGASAVTSDK